MARAGHTFEDFIADDAPGYARGRWARIGFPSAVHRHVREAHRMSRGYDIDLRPKTARAGSLAPRNRPKYAELQIVIKQFTTRWTSGTEFMAARQGRLGLLRAALGTSLETALSVVFAGNRLYPSGNPPFHTRHDPISIFVLRNNDLGDVLCSTPLFAALRQWFPAARIAAGVGRWAEPILSHNPNVDEVLLTDAPWYNKFVPDRSILAALRYITRSDQVRELARRRFDIGIDVLGSHFGALLLRRARIPWLLGVRGFAGGHSICQQTLVFEPNTHVAKFATKFAELLGTPAMPEVRPQLFLTPDERVEGETLWCNAIDGNRPERRLVIGAGNGVFTKYWPLNNYVELLARLAAERSVRIVLVGGPDDRAAAETLVTVNRRTINLCGALSLRQTFSLVAAADAVACNSSMLMHASAALAKPTAVLLGPSFAEPEQHYRLWCYEGVSFYPPSLGHASVATPSNATTLLRGLLKLPQG